LAKSKSVLVKWASQLKDAFRYRSDNSLDGRSFTFGSRMRIMYVSFNVLGAQLHANYRIGQLEALAERGHDVTWVAARTPEFSASPSELRLLTLLLRKRLPVVSLLYFQVFSIWCLVRNLRSWDVVILDPLSVPALSPILIIRRLASHFPRLFLRVTSNPVETRGHVRALLSCFIETLSIKLSARFFDGIFFISPMMARSYSERFDFSRSKTSVWPSSVDMTAFDQPSAARVTCLRKELGLSRRLGVLYHGSLGGSRGILQMTEAFRILSRQSIKATLVILGDGVAREEVSKYVKANGLEQVIRLRGPVAFSEVPDYIAACDVGILALPDLPIWWFQCPLKVIECLAMNKPVIVSDIPANRWIVGKSPVGLYLEGTSPQHIANGVRRFLKTRNNLNPRLGQQIAARFSIEKVAEMVEHEMLSKITDVMNAQ